MEADSTLGIPDLVEALRNDMIESQRRLRLRQVEALRDERVQAHFAERRRLEAEIARASRSVYATGVNPIEDPQYDVLTALQAQQADLVEPPEASAITAPLKLNHIDIELKVALRVASTGHLNLTVLRGQTEAAKEHVHTVRLSLGPDIPFDIGG